MSEFDFVKLDVRPYYAFRFKMPEKVAGRQDINLIVEYALQANQVFYDVWCELDNTNMRGYVLSGSVKKEPEDTPDSITNKIIIQMNRSKKLPGMTMDWVAHVQGTCCGDPDDNEVDEDD